VKVRVNAEIDSMIGSACVTVPAYSTFCRARWDPAFKDVCARAKHFHCRCETCYKLQEEGLKKWASQINRAEFKLQHRAEVTNWRRLERHYQFTARQHPDEMLVLSYDGTVSLGLPRLTNRMPKGVPVSRLNVVPLGLTNHSAMTNYSISMLKHQYAKGANRLLTVLDHCIRATKFGQHVSRTHGSWY